VLRGTSFSHWTLAKEWIPRAPNRTEMPLVPKRKLQMTPVVTKPMA